MIRLLLHPYTMEECALLKRALLKMELNLEDVRGSVRVCNDLKSAITYIDGYMDGLGKKVKSK